MAQTEFATVVDEATRPYLKRMTGGTNDARESIALIDVYIRIAYTLVICASRQAGATPILAHAVPGTGSMLASIATAHSWPDVETSHWATRVVARMARDFIALTGRFNADSKLPTFKTIRNQFSHGYALPSRDEEATEIAGRLRNLQEQLKACLVAQLGGLRLVDGEFGAELLDNEPSMKLCVGPFWAWIGEDSAWGIYSHYGQDGVFYLVPGHQVALRRDDNSTSQFEKQYLPEARGSSPLIGRHVKDVVRDVAAFTEDGVAPSYCFGDDAEVGVVLISWVRSTSDANQERVDRFRIGPDNQYQWLNQEGSAWRPYSDFLKEVANWGLLARRVRIGLDTFSGERRSAEASYLESGRSDVRGPARLKEVSEYLLLPEVPASDFKLMQRVDSASESLRSSTKVFFIVGQAGLGKTELMLSVASERALEIEKDTSISRPLYLFVSSTGRTLSSLEDAINSALNITKLLSSQGAKALCRNGLLVLIVDGFDELLGSSGYENALGSLEPWFRELGGRGVLVASARSSYYLAQYRKSLSETTGVNADHTLLQIQPWSRDDVLDYFRRSGVPDDVWLNLQERDWQLLGVPFFAKAFAKWSEGSGHKSDGQRSIFDIVVDQYLARESQKLVDPNRGPLFNPEELREFFAEVAELMHDSGQREVEHSDLVMCAQLVIGSEALESVRPGLTRRLSSLCGFGVEGGTATTGKFYFAHEVMFDCFLSLSLQRKVSSSRSAEVWAAFFSKGKIHPAAVDWLVGRLPEAAATLLRKLQRVPLSGSAYSENVGFLWTSLCKASNDIPPSLEVHGLRLGELELAESDWGHLKLQGCQLTRLRLPATGLNHVDLSDCEVELLECDSLDRARAVLTCRDSDGIGAFSSNVTYDDTPHLVRRRFEELGLMPMQASGVDDDFTESAIFFLEKISSRFDTSIVATENSGLTDDQRLNWTQRLGARAWTRFTEALIGSGLARWEPISARGSAKVRLVFEVSPASIRRRERDDLRIAAFWSTKS